MAQPARAAERGGAEGKCSSALAGFVTSALGDGAGSALAGGMAASRAGVVSAGGLALSRYTASAVLVVFILGCILLFPQRAARNASH